LIRELGKTSMWYFSWVLGTGFALAFGVLNAIWYEITDTGEQGEGGGTRRERD
jgi:cytochrome bd-I ubiquinol oxidase subunit X